MLFRSLSGGFRNGWSAACLLFLVVANANAQSGYDFTGPPVLVSGIALQEGAVYRYQAVAPGVDALVEIDVLNNATLSQLDDTTGVARALQPEIDGDAVGSYVELNLTFVDSGKSVANPITGIFSALDVDSMLEFYTFFDVSDYTVESTNDLSLAVVAPQTLEVSGGGAGHSPTSIDHTGVIVSIAVNELSAFTYRIGVNGNETRQTSLLFEPIDFDAPLFTNINDAPQAVADTNSLIQNSTLSVNASNGLLSNDTDLDIGIDTDVLSVDTIEIGGTTLVTGSSHSLVEGEITVNTDGSYEFIPAVNYSGAVPVIAYRLSDGKGRTDESALTLVVVASGVPPDANADNAVLTSYDPLIISVLDNDSDDGSLDVNSLLWVANLSVYPNGSSLSSDSRQLTIANEGRWTITGAEVRFLPNADTTGQITPVVYQVADNDGETASAIISLEDGLATDAPTVVIAEDVNDDGYVSLSEVSGQIEVSAMLPPQAMAGDVVNIISGGVAREVTLDASDLLAGVVSVSFTVPSDGSLFQVQASLIDASGNISVTTDDQATIDISAPESPVVSITTDQDNSGFISSQEFADSITVEVLLPATVSVNDILIVTSGATSIETLLTPTDIADGTFSTTIDAPADGDTLSVIVHITDDAGNQSASGTDSAMVDISAPGLPVVDALVSASTTPQLRGRMPVDNNYLLAVEVNSVIYVKGDGHLSVGSSGDWVLEIPSGDALDDGIYEVVVVVTDMAGNASTDVTASELTIDLQAPALAANTVGPSSDNSPLMSGNSDQADGTQVRVQTQEGVRVCDAVVESLEWRCAALISLPVGLSTLQATVVDAAGNATTKEFTVTVSEAADTDGDGIPDDLETNADFDGDGVANYLDLDSDNDTIADALEGQIDSDGDGVKNYLDIDSDNDGVSDFTEAKILKSSIGQIHSQISGDTNVSANGLADAAETSVDSGLGIVPVDTDNDSIPDYLDLDSDNDGISDVVENGHMDTDADARRADGVLVEGADFDRDGVPNFLDLDSDQDGIPDIRERPAGDSDGDGRVDNPLDADNNGLAENIAGSTGLIDELAQDLDGDGYPNYLDLDSDGDGNMDLMEAFGSDTDGDGIVDVYLDVNDNQVPDAIDVLLTLGVDQDGDVIDDLFDADFAAGADTDEDGIVDAFDVDANGNGFADVHDNTVVNLPDSNNDGVSDVYDVVTPQVSSRLQTGVGGLGCSLQPFVSRQAGSPLDLFLFSLLAVALAGLNRKKLKTLNFQ